MEATSILPIVAPTPFPAAASLGADPVHLGAPTAVDGAVGPCGPPAGPTLRGAAGATGTGVGEQIGAMGPWRAAMPVVLAPATRVPGLARALPHLLGIG